VDTHESLGTLINVGVAVGTSQFNRTLVISHTVYVSYDLYQETPVGSEVDIVYLANDPKISALGYMVELVRSAMKN